MVGGIRFLPTPIKRYVIEDVDTGEFFGGWHDSNAYPTMHCVHWTQSERYRVEFESYTEAEFEASLIVELGCRGERVIDVRSKVFQ